MQVLVAYPSMILYHLYLMWMFVHVLFWCRSAPSVHVADWSNAGSSPFFSLLLLFLSSSCPAVCPTGRRTLTIQGLGDLSFTWGRAFFTFWHESVNSILFTLLHQKCKNAWPNPTKVKLSQDSHLARILRSVGQNRQIAGQEDDRNSNRSERRENLQRYFRPPRRTEGYRGEGEAEAMVWICQW